MIIQSKINFKEGVVVIYNSEFHGFIRIGSYKKIKDRIGVVLSVERKRRADGRSCGVWLEPSGRVIVEWEDGTISRVWSKHLTILDDFDRNRVKHLLDKF